MTPGNRYDAFAAQYNRLMQGGYYDYGKQADALARVVPAGVSILEIGVGTGLLAKELVGRGWRVTGVDHTDEMLEQARELLGPEVALARADVVSFDLGARFDVVISNGGVWYGIDDEGTLGYCGHLDTIDDVRSSLARVAAHLEPEGVLVLSLQAPHLDRDMDLPDEVVYRQRITDRGTTGPVHAIDKEYRFERNGETLLTTTLRLAYLDAGWWEAELAKHGFGGPERTDDGLYVVFRRG